jgi:hypothetical protein
MKFYRRLNLELRFQNARSEGAQKWTPRGDSLGPIQKIWSEHVIIINKYQKAATGLLDTTQSGGG